MTTSRHPAPARRRGRRPVPARSCGSASTSWAPACSRFVAGPCAVETPEQLAAACEAAVAAGRHDAARRPVQAPDVAVLVPGSRRRRARDGGRAARALRTAVGGGGARRPQLERRRRRHRRRARRGAQHAELRAPARVRPDRQAGDDQARARPPRSRSGCSPRSTSRTRATSTSSCASAASGRSSRRPATRSTSRQWSSRRSARISR